MVNPRSSKPVTDFIITAPNGKKYKVNGPPGSTKEDALRQVQQKLGAMPQDTSPTIPQAPEPSGPPALSWGQTGMDALKSFGTGLGQGAISLAALPQDAGQGLAHLATGGIDRLIGYTPEQIAQRQAKADQISQSTPLAPPTSQGVTKAVESVTGPFYQPKTALGQYANTTGQFAAGAAAGPGGLLRKAAMTVIPGIASEGAGQLTAGTAAEPYMRFAGALAGGLASAGGKGNAMKQMRKEAPTFEQVANEKNALYSALNDAEIKFDPNSFDNMMTGLAGKLKLFRAKRAPLSTDAVDNMSSFQGKAPTFQEVEDMLVEAKGILREPNASNADKSAAHILVDHLSNFFDNAPLTSNGNIAASDVAAVAKTARELARRHIIAREANKMVNKSEWYTSGEESGLRNQFSSFGKKQGSSLTDAEKAAAKKVIRREGAYSLLNSAGSKLGSIALGGAGLWSGIGAVPTGIGLATHLAARKASEALTKKSVADFIKITLAGKTAQEEAAAVAKQSLAKANTRRLISGTSGALSRGQPVMYTDANGNSYGYDGKLITP